MKKLLNFLRSDNVLRNNILYAGALALLFSNIAGLIIGLDGYFKEGNFNNMQILFLPALCIDVVFIISLLFMYVIPENLFRIKNAISISFVISVVITAYFAYGAEIPYRYLIADTIKNTIRMSYAIIVIGIIIRGFWEDMQYRVGGRYNGLDLTYSSILSYSNICLVSISGTLLFLTDIISQDSIINSNFFVNSILLGLIVFTIGSFIRLIISYFIHIVKKA